MTRQGSASATRSRATQCCPTRCRRSALELARRAVAAIEAAHPDLDDEWCQRAAALALEADDRERAPGLLFDAGRRALAAGALRTAESALERGRDIALAGRSHRGRSRGVPRGGDREHRQPRSCSRDRMLVVGTARRRSRERDPSLRRRAATGSRLDRGEPVGRGRDPRRLGPRRRGRCREREAAGRGRRPGRAESRSVATVATRL